MDSAIERLAGVLRSLQELRHGEHDTVDNASLAAQLAELRSKIDSLEQEILRLRVRLDALA